MAERLARDSDVGEYILYHYNAVTADGKVTGGSHGDFLGRVTVNNPGTNMVITLGNGTTATGANVIAVISNPVAGDYPYEGACDKGLFIAISGTGIGDITVSALPMAV